MRYENTIYIFSIVIKLHFFYFFLSFLNSLNLILRFLLAFYILNILTQLHSPNSLGEMKVWLRLNSLCKEYSQKSSCRGSTYRQAGRQASKQADRRTDRQASRQADWLVCLHDAATCASRPWYSHLHYNPSLSERCHAQVMRCSSLALSLSL